MPETSETERADAAVVGPEADGVIVGETVPALPVVVEDLAIEDVSIDGMCGVY